MYNNIQPPHPMVQLVAGQHTNGQCPPVQNQPNPILEANYNNNRRNTQQYSHTASYSPNGNGHNRNRLMQRPTHSFELYEITGVEVPQIRRGYGRQNGGNTNGGNPHGNWLRRNNNIINNNNNGNVALTLPPPHLHWRPNNNTGSHKKPHWNNNKYGKRNNNSNKDNSTSVQNEMNNYNSDSGISSRSPTPNMQTSDSILAESSDERDSISSSVDHEIKIIPKQLRNIVQDVSIAELKEAYVHQIMQEQCYDIEGCFHLHQNFSPDIGQARTGQILGELRQCVGRVAPPIQKIQRGRKYGGIVMPKLYIYPKAVKIPGRFFATSNFVDSSKPPDNLVCHCQWDRLSEEIWAKFLVNQQSENTYNKKEMLWKYLFIHLKAVFLKYELYPVGSTLNGFGSDTSDVDICLVVRKTDDVHRNEAVWHLGRVMSALQHRVVSDVIKKVELIPAKVPILKFRDGIQDLDVDLNCNNHVSVRNTHLLYCYSQIDWRVRPLVLVIKLWAQTHDINDAKSMTISSYSLVLMVIHFLQCGVNPPVLPCLHSLFRQKFHQGTDIHEIIICEKLSLPKKSTEEMNCQPLGELLYDFLHYYAHFDFKSYAISVRTARKLPMNECRQAKSPRNDANHWNYLGIEEPFDLTNTARSVHDYDAFLRILSVFHWSYERLRDKRCLSSIFLKHFPPTNIPSPKS